MDLKTLLGSSVIAAVISGVMTFFISRKQNNLQYITVERKEWRAEIRRIAKSLYKASYDDTLIILTELKLRINAFGNNDDEKSFCKDKHIWELIKDIESKELTSELLYLKQNQMIEYLSLLLKFDWERSKNEVKGNMYNIFAFILYILDVIYFSFLVFQSNLPNKTLNSFTFIGIVVLLTVIINILFFALLKLICNCILNKEYKKNNLKLILGYIVYLLLFVVNCFIVSILVVYGFNYYKVSGINQLIMELLIVLLFAGLAFQYVSHILYIDRVFFYNDAIIKIKEKYQKMENGEKIQVTQQQ